MSPPSSFTASATTAQPNRPGEPAVDETIDPELNLDLVDEEQQEPTPEPTPRKKKPIAYPEYNDVMSDDEDVEVVSSLSESAHVLC